MAVGEPHRESSVTTGHSVTESDSSSQPGPILDRAETIGAAHATLRHLQSVGVDFVPRAREEGVAAWAERFGEDLSTSESSGDGVAAVASSGPPDRPRPNGESTRPTRGTNAGPAPPDRSIPSEPSNDAAVPNKPSILFGADQEAYSVQTLAPDERSRRLVSASERVASCTRCELLASCRTQTVYGEGSPNPRLVFFGEGPGADEDRTGRPFVGAAGQLLDKIIVACGQTRQDVYILNTVKCRPPGNRNPTPEEISNCRGYFEEQLEWLQPEYIICLGLIAGQTLLNTKLSVGRMRGKLHRYKGSKVLVTYHPAYLLRTPNAKRACWDDLKIMLADANIALPGSK